MTYNELKKIAQPHLRINGELPSNSFLLLTQLHIPFKTQKQCEEDYNGKMTPLYNQPAFLAVDSSGNKTVYFNSNTRYWNFYIFHEIAHYILGHENDSPQNEMDADLLACILTAPIDNLPSNINSARNLSATCLIPIDKAEMYWNEINKYMPKLKKIVIVGICSAIILLSSITICLSSNNTETKEFYNYNNIIEPSASDSLYMTTYGTKYHRSNCQYVKYKTNTISITINEAKKLNLKPCKKCIR